MTGSDYSVLKGKGLGPICTVERSLWPQCREWARG